MSASAGRVLGSQIYIGPSPEEAQGEVPFSLRDVFINNVNGEIYQYDGTNWIYCYTLAGEKVDSVYKVLSDDEALELNIGSVALVAPLGATAHMARVITNEIGEKSLAVIGLGDGSLAFVTSAASNLQNYYLKSETYDKGEVDALLSSIHTIEFVIVAALPPEGQSNIIYLVPHDHGSGDRYDEYCWVESQHRFERLGNTDIDLSDYYTKSEVDALLVGKANVGDSYLKAEADAKLALKADKSDTYTKAEVDSKVSATYRYRGSLVAYSDLPLSGMSVGDVYNIETADPIHGVKAGDNVAWNGMSWDVLSGMIDLSAYYTKSEVDVLMDEKPDYDDVYSKQAVDAALNAKVDKVSGKGLSESDFTLNEKIKLAGIEDGAEANDVTSVAGRTGAVTLGKSDVGLSHVDDTADLDKPISRATQLALNDKVEMDLSELDNECLILIAH